MEVAANVELLLWRRRSRHRKAKYTLSFLLVCFNTDRRAWQATVHRVTKVLVTT